MKTASKIPVDQVAALTQLYDRITHFDLSTLSTDIDEFTTMIANLATPEKATTAAEGCGGTEQSTQGERVTQPRHKRAL